MSRRHRDAPQMVDETGTRCPSRKRAFLTRRDAKLAAKHQPGRSLRAFPCKLCPYYHLGTMPAVIARGELNRSPVQRPRDR